MSWHWRQFAAAVAGRLWLALRLFDLEVQYLAMAAQLRQSAAGGNKAAASIG